MNDDVLPPDLPSDELLAVSAALDGSATADERALIDASPELTRLLEDLRSQQRSIRDVQAPAAARDSAIAAALAVFDEVHQPVPAHAANVVSLASRRRWYRLVTAAAAALVLVVAGVAAIGSLGGGSDDEASTADVAVSAKSPSDAAASQAETETPAPLAADASEATSSPAATDAGGLDAAQTAPTEGGGTPPGATPVPTIGSIGAAGDVRPTIDNEAELASFAANAAVRDVGPDQCAAPDDQYLGEVSYRGTPAVVARDPDTGTVTVYAADGCAVLTTLQT